jgi:hypothetical protein
MGLAASAPLRQVNTEGVVQLSAADLPAMQTLYHEAYPENVFDQQMLTAGQYYGIREGSILVSIAGVHAFSPAYKVAAIGNVAIEHKSVRRALPDALA